MTVNGYPFDGQVTDELEWRILMRNLMSNGVINGELGELLVHQRTAGPNMSIEVDTGHAFAVGHYAISDAVESIAIPNNATGNDRIDLIVIGWDFGANLASIYRLGGAAGGPVAPTPTQDIETLWEDPLAEVLVQAGESTSIVNADIDDVRAFAERGGGGPDIIVMQSFT